MTGISAAGRLASALLQTRYLTLNPEAQKLSEPAFKLFGTHLTSFPPQRLVFKILP